MSTKGLLIKSYTDKTGSRGQWNELEDTHSYIQGIRTGEVKEGQKAEIFSALLSGLPSPWARAKLFEFALKTLNTPDPNIGESGLLQVYKGIHAEWQGLFALIALYSDRISFSEAVKLDYRKDNYDIAAAMGRMLFDERDIWSDAEALPLEKNGLPFIHLIYYNQNLIGGTSPVTGVFTGVSYTLGDAASDIPWFREGKLEEPTKHLNSDQLNKVYIFVRNLRSNIQEFEKKINSYRRYQSKPEIELTGFKGMLERWEKAINTTAREKEYKLATRGSIASYGNLEKPIANLFHSDVPVYLKPDMIFTYTKPDGEGFEVIDNIQGLLSDHKAVLGWIDGKDPQNKLGNAPVYYLCVDDVASGDHYYFTVPLSDRALRIFRNSMSSLLGYTSRGNATITGNITEQGKLAVALTIEVDGAPIALNTREYSIVWGDERRVIVWPNFQSERWKNYYLYSEFTGSVPHRFYPIFQKGNGYILDDHKKELFVRRDKTTSTNKDVNTRQLIEYDSNVQENKPKYDILYSDRPIGILAASTRIEGQEVSAGYLIVRTDEGGLQDLGQLEAKLDATIGIDFGSNNTSVYYAIEDRDSEAAPIKFENNRLVLVGLENHDPKALAELNELLFFSNYPATNGQLKSWLHEHESNYNKHNESDEIAGGVPVNRHNIRVEKMDKFQITTQAGILHYNMKWLNDDKGRMKKTAFLKSVWLQSCAYLFRQQIKPTKIHWSSPGAMMEADRTNLEMSFSEIAKVTPIEGNVPVVGEDRSITEAEAVCNFALTQEFGLTENNLILGIDVGGSTSDILILGKEPDPKAGNKPTLLRESSVRVAAGVLSEATKRSEDFRKAILAFHEGKRTNVYLENISEILTTPDKAPFFLTSVFDQLQGDDFETFYTIMAERAKSVFAIPAYLTGLLMFYSGILIGRVLQDHESLKINEIYILAFGKGGRIFHWLRSMPGSRIATEYYKACLQAGLGQVLSKEGQEVKSDFEVHYRDETKIRENSKAEVAKGLCVLREDLKIKSLSNSDVCGEMGVRYTNKNGEPLELSTDSDLSADYFKELSRFSFTSTDNFKKFIDIYLHFVGEKTGICKDASKRLEGDIKDLPGRIENFIANDDEYKKACKNAADNGGAFQYHQPIFIAEGLCIQHAILEKLLK